MLGTEHTGRTVNQLLRRVEAMHRERRQSDELSLKRQRSDNGNNNSPDVISHMPQVTAADFSKHNNNNTPPMKDAERIEDYSTDSTYSIIRFFSLLNFQPISNQYNALLQTRTT